LFRLPSPNPTEGTISPTAFSKVKTQTVGVYFAFAEPSKSIFEMQLFFFIWTFAENFFFCIEERVLAKRKLKKKDKKKTFTNKRSFFLDACQKKNAKK